MYRVISVGIGFLLILLALGCGSSGSDATTAGVTKAQWVKQANAVCAKGGTEIKAAAAAWEKAQHKKLDIEAATKEILGPSLKRQAKELDALEAPQEEKEQVARMLGNLSKAAADFSSKASLQSSGFEQWQQEAEAYGLKACNL